MLVHAVDYGPDGPVDYVADATVDYARGCSLWISQSYGLGRIYPGLTAL